MHAGSKSVSAVGAPASHIVHIFCFVRLLMSTGVLGSVQGAAVEAALAGDFGTTFRSSGALANSQVSVHPSSKTEVLKLWVH